jgi:hypothetical protein
MHLSVSFVTPPQFCELLPQRPNTDLIFGIALGIGHHNSNAPHSVTLLRARIGRESRGFLPATDKLVTYVDVLVGQLCLRSLSCSPFADFL